MEQTTRAFEKSPNKRSFSDIFGSIVLLAAAFALTALPIWVFMVDGFTWRAIGLAIAQTPVISMLAWAGFKSGWGEVCVPSQEQQALEKLIRPIRWAGHASVLGVLMALMMWQDGLLTLDSSTVVLISLLGMAAAFSLWGVSRVTDYFWSK